MSPLELTEVVRNQDHMLYTLQRLFLDRDGVATVLAASKYEVE